MRTHGKENPLLTEYEKILDIARKHNVTLSLGDGLRPGTGSDAGDPSQWDEVIMLGRVLPRRAGKKAFSAWLKGRDTFVCMKWKRRFAA
jgi:phosphomethylpyrimidine synthase